MNNPIFSAVSVNAGGTVNKVSIEASKIETSHTRGDILDILERAIQEEVEKGYGIYSWDKEKTMLLFGPLLERGQADSLKDGLLHSIAEENSPVKYI